MSNQLPNRPHENGTAERVWLYVYVGYTVVNLCSLYEIDVVSKEQAKLLKSVLSKMPVFGTGYMCYICDILVLFSIISFPK